MLRLDVIHNSYKKRNEPLQYVNPNLIKTFMVALELFCPT